jgi:uncharacterized delta-60 repeat protein
MSLLVVAVAAFAAPPAAGAAAALRGVLDSSFGDGGRVASHLGRSLVSSQFEAMVRQPDGKLVLTGRVGGKVVVQRRQPDGSLDAGFGNGGVVSFPKAGGLSGLAVDGQGRILFGIPAGQPCFPSAVRRILPTGAPDQSFGGGDGVATAPLTVRRLARDGAGRIVLAGYAASRACGKYIPPQQITLARLEANGTPDRSFGEEGIVSFRDEIGENSSAFGLAIREDETILVAGNRQLLAYTPDGRLDPSFGTGGVAEAVGGPKILLALPGGGAVVASSSSSSPFECCPEPGDFIVSRYRPDGSLDPSFGTGGTVTLDVDEMDEATALAPAPGGSFLLAGTSSANECPSGECPAASILARLTASGRLDPSFGTAGWTPVSIPAKPRPYGFEPRLPGLVVLPDGHIVAAGSAGSYSDAFIVARDPSGGPDPSFGNGGSITEVRTRPSSTAADGLAITAGGEILVSAGSNVDDHGSRGIMLVSKPSGGFVPDGGYQVDETGGVLWGRRGKYLYSLASDRVVHRLDSHGRPDRGYGSQGAAALPPKFQVATLDVSRSGKVVAVGHFRNREGMAAVALNPDGHLDPGFGHDGVALVRFGGDSRIEALAVGIDSKGRVTLFGRAGAKSIAARLTPAGRLDRSFAQRGRLLHLPFSGLSETRVTVLPDDRVLLAARPDRGPGSSLLILRLNRNGTVDRSFGHGGKIRVESWGPGLALFASRRQLVLVSARWPGGAGGVVLRAFEPDGAVDRRFGHRGVAFFARRSPRYFRAVAAARQPNGRIVVAATRGRLRAGADVELLRFR